MSVSNEERDAINAVSSLTAAPWHIITTIYGDDSFDFFFHSYIFNQSRFPLPLISRVFIRYVDDNEEDIFSFQETFSTISQSLFFINVIQL